MTTGPLSEGQEAKGTSRVCGHLIIRFYISIIELVTMPLR